MEFGPLDGMGIKHEHIFNNPIIYMTLKAINAGEISAGEGANAIINGLAEENAMLKKQLTEFIESRPQSILRIEKSKP